MSLTKLRKKEIVKDKSVYINLDSAASTPPFASVERKIKKFMQTYGSVHRGAGRNSKLSTNAYDAARARIGRFVNARDSDYVVFTSNTTGAMNQIAHYLALIKGKVAVSAIEHSSSSIPFIVAEGQRHIAGGFDIKEMDNINSMIQKKGIEQVLEYPVNADFEFDLDAIEKMLIAENIKALVLTASSNATGYCPPIKEIGRLAHKHSALFIVDACQYIQHHPIDIKEWDADFLCASGHKFYAPYGSGFYIAPKNFMDSFLPHTIGGGNLPYITKERSFLRYKNVAAHDPGTPNAAGIIAMATAMDVLEKMGMDNVEQYESHLTRMAFAGLAKIKGVELLVKKEHLCTVLPFNINGWDCYELAEQLSSRFNIGVRAGNFCVYSFTRSLLNISDDAKIIDNIIKGQSNATPGFVRASFSLLNNKKDVVNFIKAVCILARERND